MCEWVWRPVLAEVPHGTRLALRYACTLGWCLRAVLCILLFGAPHRALAGTFTPSQTTFSPTGVGQSSPAVTVTLVLQASGMTDAPKALTGGAAGQDFSIADAGTCTGSLSAGQSCTLQAVFSPKYPGVRRGAIVLAAGPQVLAETMISGVGQGGLPVLMPGRIDRRAGLPKQWLYHGDGVAATSATVYLPTGLAVDGAGDLYLSDTGTNNRVRRVDASSGMISTVAGSGVSGSGGDGGPATTAQMNTPSGLALDGAGNLYLADSGNSTVRRVDAVTGLITTVAGMPGVSGYAGDGGLAMSAKLNSPQGLAFTPSGDLVIADTGNNVIRVLTLSDGKIQTVAGKGSAGYSGDGGAATAAQLSAPWGVAVRSDGAIAIADLNNNCVRLVSPAGVMTTVAGNGTLGFTGDSGDATQAELNGPAAVAFDPAGDLIIADSGNNRIRGVYGPFPGTIVTIAGTSSTGAPDADGDGGPASQASLYGPYALVFDAQGNIWISDMFHNVVREISGSQLLVTYPTIKVGKKSAAVAETLYNGGNEALMLSAPVLDQAALDAGSTTCGQAAISPGQFCVMGLVFAPTQVGNSVTGTVQWVSNAPNVTPVDQLQGQVLSVEPTTVAITANPNPGLAGRPVVLTATVTSADTGRTGTVDFAEGQQVWCSGMAVGADGKAACTIQSLSLGSHTFVADYSGDNDNAASDSQPFVLVVKQQPTLVLSASSNPAVVTNNVTFTLTAAATVGKPTGTVVLYDGTTALATLTLDASGHATWSTESFGVGIHPLMAQYAGDSSDVAGTSNVLNEKVDQATTATVLQSSNTSPTVGSSVVLTANVVSTNGPAPTGSVQFDDGTVVLGTAPLSSDGRATLTVSTLTPGAHGLTVAYNGDTNDQGSNSAAMNVIVQQIGTVTNLAADTSPLSAGATLHLTATVLMGPGNMAYGQLAGNVTFKNGGTLLGTAAISSTGQAKLAVSTLAVGTHSLLASFSGDTNYAASDSNALKEIVQQTTTSVGLSTTASPTLIGKMASFTARVTSATGVPTGSVTFKDGNAVLGTVAPNAGGVASLSTTQLSAGDHAITAIYSGDVDYLGATSAAVQQTVNLAQTTLTLSGPARAVDEGTSAQFTAVLQSPGITPTGTVTLLDGAAVIDTQTVSGMGTFSFTTAGLSVGTHALTAKYGGDGNNAGVTSAPITVVIRQGATLTTLVSSANPLTEGGALTLVAMVTSPSPAISGRVSLYDGNTLLDSVAVGANGKVTFSPQTLSLGVHQLTATYGGDGNHIASTSVAVPELVVQNASASLSSSVSPSITGINVLFTAQIMGSPVPTGSVLFEANGVALATVPLNGLGTAAFSTAGLSVGSHAITATYSGDGNFDAVTAQLTQTVLNATTQTALAVSANPASYGQPLTFSTVVGSNGGMATGSVRFTEGGNVLGTAQLDAAGKAVWTTTTLSPGIHSVVAAYVGDGRANASNSTALSVVVKQTTGLAVTSDANPTQTLNAVLLTSTVRNPGAAPATGSVIFNDGAVELGTALVDGSGHATLTVPQMSAGTHTIIATYEGDGANFASVSPALSQEVRLRPTTTAVSGTATDTANPQQMTLIAVVHGEGSVAPSGMVTFTSGNLTLGATAIDENGVASITVIFETKTMPVVASFAGDASYTASHSAQTPITAGDPAQFTLAVSAPNITLVSHNRATVTLTLRSVKGFTDTINLGCLGLPYAATCSFDKSQVKLLADGTATAQVIVDTGNPLGAGTSTSAAVRTGGDGRGVLLCLMPAGLLLGGLARSRRRLGRFLVLLVGLVLAGGAVGCGGLKMSGTPAGDYTFKVIGTGQGSGTSEAQTVVLVVTQ